MRPRRIVIWLNGRFTPLSKARISPLDRGFLYGDGIFETIRADRGKISWLSTHVERLQESLSLLRITLDPTPDWKYTLQRLLEENRLDSGVAAIKIIVTRGISNRLGLPAPQKPTVCATATSYDPPQRESYDTGWKLHVYTEGRAPALSRFKSLNYLFFLTARQAAVDVGCDMAVILDHHGFVTETCAGTLLAKTDGQWWTPQSSFQLPGTTLRCLSAIMENSGLKIEARAARIEDFFSAQTVWTLNSLIGIMPVVQIDGHPLPDPAPVEAGYWRARLFEVENVE